MSNTHYEVVDADNRIVGNIKQTTPAQARDLRRALLADGHNGVLGIAMVTERLVVHRDIVLLSPEAEV